MKVIKLFFIALVVIGAIIGLTLIIPESKPIEGPEVSSAAGESWKKKIDDLCKDSKWTIAGYAELDNGIQIDMRPNVGNLSIDEGRALQDYLYASSCLYVKDEVDKYFKQKSYTDNKITHFQSIVSKLKEKGQANSNLAEASNMLNAYRQLMAALSPRSGVAYSHPLKAYSGNSGGSTRSRILSMPYYKSHFSNNQSIVAKVNALGESASNGEYQYYADLEQQIERHYNSTKDYDRLLEDQISFNTISTNKDAISRLEAFIRTLKNI